MGSSRPSTRDFCVRVILDWHRSKTYTDVRTSIETPPVSPHTHMHASTRHTHRVITDVADAGKRLREGGLVAFPTETVYGLGASAYNEASVRRIFEVRLAVRLLGGVYVRV